MQALAQYQRGALTEARNMRVAAEATIDPMTRLADMMERKQLAESPLDADALVERAREMLDAGQPKRAALFLDAATDKGGSMAVRGVREAVEDALDGAIPERTTARIIEQDVTASMAGFRQARLRQLYDSRLGVRRTSGDEPSEVGSGDTPGITGADLAAKIEAWATSRETGQPYVELVPETSLPNLNTPADSARERPRQGCRLCGRTIRDERIVVVAIRPIDVVRSEAILVGIRPRQRASEWPHIHTDGALSEEVQQVGDERISSVSRILAELDPTERHEVAPFQRPHFTVQEVRVHGARIRRDRVATSVAVNRFLAQSRLRWDARVFHATLHQRSVERL